MSDNSDLRGKVQTKATYQLVAAICICTSAQIFCNKQPQIRFSVVSIPSSEASPEGYGPGVEHTDKQAHGSILLDICAFRPGLVHKLIGCTSPVCHTRPPKFCPTWPQDTATCTTSGRGPIEELCHYHHEFESGHQHVSAKDQVKVSRSKKTMSETVRMGGAKLLKLCSRLHSHRKYGTSWEKLKHSEIQNKSQAIFYLWLGDLARGEIWSWWLRERKPGWI